MSELVGGVTELSLIRKCIVPASIVFDVGAYQGLWSDLVLRMNPAEIHLFEPMKECYQGLVNKFTGLIDKNQVFISNVALSNHKGTRDFYVYSKHPTLSSFYRRVRAEKQHKLGEPNSPILVSTTTVDDYCIERKIKHVNYLKIDVEGAEFEVIVGADRLLTSHDIDYVEFEYGGTYLDSNTTLEKVYTYLNKKGYRIYEASSGTCSLVSTFLPGCEDYLFSIFIALSPNVTFKDV